MQKINENMRVTDEKRKLQNSDYINQKAYQNQIDSLLQIIR